MGHAWFCFSGSRVGIGIILLCCVCLCDRRLVVIILQSHMYALFLRELEELVSQNMCMGGGIMSTFEVCGVLF